MQLSSRSSADSFKLFDYELMGQSFDHMNLISLNACETNAGLQHESEGIFSFTHAFSHTGAQSILTNLWKVDDETAMKISLSFFKNYHDDLRSSMALRNAKLEFLSKSEKWDAHPFFWGAPIIYNTYNFEEVRSAKRHLILIISILSIIFLFSLVIINNKKDYGIG